MEVKLIVLAILVLACLETVRIFSFLAYYLHVRSATTRVSLDWNHFRIETARHVLLLSAAIFFLLRARWGWAIFIVALTVWLGLALYGRCLLMYSEPVESADFMGSFMIHASRVTYIVRDVLLHGTCLALIARKPVRELFWV